VEAHGFDLVEPDVGSSVFHRKRRGVAKCAGPTFMTARPPETSALALWLGESAYLAYLAIPSRYVPAQLSSFSAHSDGLFGL
jgi:hypothetical protein